MRFFQKILLILIFFKFSFYSNAAAVPESFADLAEKLMPSVVNISTTQTVRTTSNQFPFQFPPGSSIHCLVNLPDWISLRTSFIFSFVLLSTIRLPETYSPYSAVLEIE